MYQKFIEKSWWTYLKQFIMSNITYIWDDVDNYLQYFGGTTGALALAGITAASVYYYVSRPVPEKPLVPLHNQGPILEICWINNSFRHGQRNEYVSVNSTAANGTYLALQVDLLKSYTNPTWNIELFRWSLTSGFNILLNSSIRVCEIKRFSARNPFIKGFMKVILELTNFTLTCPLKANRYYVHLNADSIQKIFPPLETLSQPSTRFHLQNRFYEQNPRGNYTLLAELVMNLVARSDC